MILIKKKNLVKWLILIKHERKSRQEDFLAPSVEGCRSWESAFEILAFISRTSNWEVTLETYNDFSHEVGVVTWQRKADITYEHAYRAIKWLKRKNKKYGRKEVTEFNCLSPDVYARYFFFVSFLPNAPLQKQMICICFILLLSFCIWFQSSEAAFKNIKKLQYSTFLSFFSLLVSNQGRLWTVFFLILDVFI